MPACAGMTVIQSSLSILERLGYESTVDFGGARATYQRQSAIYFVTEYLNCPRCTNLSRDCCPVQHRSSQQHGFCSQRERLDDIAASPETAVDQYRHAMTNRIHHTRQRIYRCHGTVEV